jgi:hypothetical protein
MATTNTKTPKRAKVEIARTGSRARVSISKGSAAVLLPWEACYEMATKLMRIAAEIRKEQEAGQ